VKFPVAFQVDTANHLGSLLISDLEEKQKILLASTKQGVPQIVSTDSKGKTKSLLPSSTK
jgi:hypothetical protein